MSLMSPTSAGGSRQSSRPSSITSILESDGYFSDQVFDGEEMEGPVISRALSSLISAPASSFDPTPMTSRFSEKVKLFFLYGAMCVTCGVLCRVR